MIKIQIKSIFGSILFEYEKENNNIRETIEKAISDSVDLRSADLSSANLSYSNLSYANLRYADLSYANLSSVNLSSADLRYANLRSADLSSANLRYANLSFADLRYANLNFADLRYADLSSANLSYSNLSYANLSKRYIQISCIGSAKRMTTYCFDDDVMWCGCFKGSLKEFHDSVNKTHKDNAQYLKEYMGAINYIESLK